MVIEEAAQRARQSLGLGTMDPVAQADGGLVTLLEDNGIVLVRDPDTDKNIDAYSAVVNDQPIVVLDGAETDWDRDNFNVAHELGHLVMHRDTKQRPGTRTAEAEAHRFAGALLAPRAAILDEIPSDLDWGEYLQLKLRWGLSMAALVHRAHDLGVITDSLYERAMKQRSAYGWRRVEPGRDTWPLIQPSLLAEAAATGDLSIEEIAKSAGIPVAVAGRILGPGPRPQVRAVR